MSQSEPTFSVATSEPHAWNVGDTVATWAPDPRRWVRFVHWLFQLGPAIRRYEGRIVSVKSAVLEIEGDVRGLTFPPSASS